MTQAPRKAIPKFWISTAHSTNTIPPQTESVLVTSAERICPSREFVNWKWTSTYSIRICGYFRSGTCYFLVSQRTSFTLSHDFQTIENIFFQTYKCPFVKVFWWQYREWNSEARLVLGTVKAVTFCFSSASIKPPSRSGVPRLGGFDENPKRKELNFQEWIIGYQVPMKQKNYSDALKEMMTKILNTLAA